MKSTNKKYLTIVGLIWAACLILLFFVYMLMVGPQLQTKKQVEKELAEKKQAYASALKAEKEETQNRLKANLKSAQDRLKDFVIDFSESANLTFDISRIANLQRISSFSIKSQDNRGLAEIPNCNYISEGHIEVSFSADFSQFAAFLNALEKHQPVLFAKNMTITRSEQEELKHLAKFGLVVLVKKQQGI